MASALSVALRAAAELQMRTWKAHEQIYAALGYAEIPAEHVVDAVVEGVQNAALALGTDHERAKLFRVRKAIEQKRKVFVPEADQCFSCGEPLGATDDEEIRECPECWTKVDQAGLEQRE
jgi:hypothetical protein